MDERKLAKAVANRQITLVEARNQCAKYNLNASMLNRWIYSFKRVIK